MSNSLFSQLPAVISAGSKDILGIIALSICAMAILAAYLFKNASERTRVLIYVIIIVSLVVAIGLFVSHDGDRRDTDRKIVTNQQVLPAPTNQQVANPTQHAVSGVRTGWVYYEVQYGEPTPDGQLVPAAGGAMPAFDDIHAGAVLRAQSRVRMQSGPTNSSLLIELIAVNDCVEALDGRRPIVRLGTKSGGWILVNEAECPRAAL